MSRDLDRELGGLLGAQIGAVLSYTAAAAREMGVGISEIGALEHLQGSDGLTPGQLGSKLAMTSGAVTALVDRLERAGYVERVPNPRDRRSSIVRVTRWGAERGMQRLGPLAEELGRLMAEMTEGEKRAAAKFVAGVTAAIQRQTAPKA